jgi:hypothetical protein
LTQKLKEKKKKKLKAAKSQTLELHKALVLSLHDLKITINQIFPLLSVLSQRQ